MVEFFRQLPGWLLVHPWWASLILVGGLALFSSLILLNPNDRQVRELWRRK